MSLLLTLPVTTAAAKGNGSHKGSKVQYLQYEDMRRYHFGFFIGTHVQDMQIQHSGFIDENGNRWFGSIPSYTPGFTVGVLGDLRLADFLSLRLSPSINFGAKQFSLISDEPDAETVTTNVRSNYVMIPLALRYRGARTNNYRPYLMAGLSMGIDVGSRKQEPVVLRRMNYFVEFGFGCDLYLPYFRLVPEIKFCLGLNDAFEHDRLDEGSLPFIHYTQAFDKMTARLIVLSFQFE